MLVEAYGHNIPPESTCRQWFRRFKNNNFDLEDEEREWAPKIFEDKDLESILDEDPCQSETQLAEALNVTSNAFQNDCIEWEWFKRREIGCYMIWQKEQ